jgi:hypothetical protein
MSVLDGPGEGTWSVFAYKVVQERDALRGELSDALALCNFYHSEMLKAHASYDKLSMYVAGLRCERLRPGFSAADCGTCQPCLERKLQAHRATYTEKGLLQEKP